MKKMLLLPLITFSLLPSELHCAFQLSKTDIQKAALKRDIRTESLNITDFKELLELNPLVVDGETFISIISAPNREKSTLIIKAIFEKISFDQLRSGNYRTRDNQTPFYVIAGEDTIRTKLLDDRSVSSQIKDAIEGARKQQLEKFRSFFNPRSATRPTNRNITSLAEVVAFSRTFDHLDFSDSDESDTEQ